MLKTFLHCRAGPGPRAGSVWLGAWGTWCQRSSKLCTSVPLKAGLSWGRSQQPAWGTVP